jgi:hypothetical protein
MQIISGIVDQKKKIEKEKKFTNKNFFRNPKLLESTDPGHKPLPIEYLKDNEFRRKCTG